MDQDLQKRYLDWKKRVSDPNNKRRSMSKERYDFMCDLWENRNKNKIISSKKVKVTTPWGVFNSMTEAYTAGGISEDTLRRRINKGMDGYAREGDHNNIKYGKPIQTPFGKFNSKAEAGRFAETNNIMQNAVKKISKFVKTDPENYYYIEQTT